MKFRKIKTDIKELWPDDAEMFMQDHAEGEYTLLDVRQPGEHKEYHIPGARLIPLPELVDSLSDLDKDKPVLVYCAMGGRSKAASQILKGAGFTEIFNILGGVEAWTGNMAEGPYDFGMTMITGSESPIAILAVAYGMENGLKLFYQKIAADMPEGNTATLLNKLAGVEVKHGDRLFEIAKTLDVTVDTPEALLSRIDASLMEGGYTVDEFIDKYQSRLNTPRDVLNMAMTLEAQALDLYMRYAHKMAEPESRDILLKIADEEKAHLTALGVLMDSALP